MESSAVPVGFSVKYGRVDAMGTLSALGFTDPQPASLPVSTAAPQVLKAISTGYDTTALSGSPQVGDVLIRGQGSWTGSSPLSLSTAWARCDAALTHCTNVATSSDYTVQSADAGYVIRLAITVKNALGSTTAFATSPVVGGGTPAPTSPPGNTSAPVITGVAQDGQTLSTTTGSWSNSPTTYAYQWQRCDSGGSCTSISGATASNYDVVTADVGSTLRVVVTATNAGGSAAATSAATASVTAAPAPPAPSAGPVTTVFTGSLNSKNPSRTFSLSMGAGMSDARLSFSRCSSLTLGLSGPGFSAAAPVTGPSVLVLDTTVTGGSYGYTVSGGRCSFSLTVTAQTP
jgi:hypothetical protein